MPTVKGKKYPYTKAGVAAADRARQGNPSDMPGTKAEMMQEGYQTGLKRKRRSGYNFTKNLGKTPNTGY